MGQVELSANLANLADLFISLRHSGIYREFDKEFMSKEYNSMLVLSFLLEHNNAVVSHELSKALVRSTSQMAVLFNHMEQQGYIKRLDDEKDARQTIIQITEKGKEFHQSALQNCETLIQKIFAKMGEENSSQFVAAFRNFLNACAEVYSEGV